LEPSAASLGAVSVLPESYHRLFARAVEVLGADERVRALWLSGSLARGAGDVASDLDLIVAVADEHHEAFAAGWEAWLAQITPTALAKPLPFAPGSFYAVTTERDRLDVVVEKAGDTGSSFFPTRTVVFDRDGLDAQVPGAVPGPGPSAATIAGIVEEQLRQAGMFDLLVIRGDKLLGIEAIYHARNLLYLLFVEANAPLPPMGVKRWSDKLTDEQRAVLEALPTGGQAHDELRQAHDEVVRAFVAHARPICERVGAPWPEALEQANALIRSRTRRPLGSTG
jgi:predicted nucleotidyltransferase